MQSELPVLLLAAVSVASLHTIAGPDHYLPFIALSKSRSWTLTKTVTWTIICGSGHVLSSIVLGLGGAALGWSIAKLTWLEDIRGGVAGWLMLIFGIVYCTWGLYRGRGNRMHKHFEEAGNGEIYIYQHDHQGPAGPRKRYKLSPMVLFIIFILGPCEPMIPLLYFPAAQNSWWSMTIVIVVYTVVTLLAMLVMVVLGFYGIGIVNTARLERWMHAWGGLAIIICGAGMLWMGW